MRLIVTRPPAQAAAWVAQLQALGLDAVALPLIGIAPVADGAPLQRAWAALGSYALVLFVSPNAVQQFFAWRGQVAWPGHTRAASTGPGTTAALREAGVAQACIAEPAVDAPSFDTEALWARLANRDWRGQRVLIVRGEEGRDWFAETMRQHGAEVDFIAAYRRLAPQADAVSTALIAAALAAPQQHLWLFSSSEAHAATWAHAGARGQTGRPASPQRPPMHASSRAALCGGLRPASLTMAPTPAGAWRCHGAGAGDTIRAPCERHALSPFPPPPRRCPAAALAHPVPAPPHGSPPMALDRRRRRLARGAGRWCRRAGLEHAAAGEDVWRAELVKRQVEDSGSQAARKRARWPRARRRMPWRAKPPPSWPCWTRGWRKRRCSARSSKT